MKYVVIEGNGWNRAEKTQTERWHKKPVSKSVFGKSKQKIGRFDCDSLFIHFSFHMFNCFTVSHVRNVSRIRSHIDRAHNRVTYAHSHGQDSVTITWSLTPMSSTLTQTIVFSLMRFYSFDSLLSELIFPAIRLQLIGLYLTVFFAFSQPISRRVFAVQQPADSPLKCNLHLKIVVLDNIFACVLFSFYFNSNFLCCLAIEAIT